MYSNFIVASCGLSTYKYFLLSTQLQPQLLNEFVLYLGAVMKIRKSTIEKIQYIIIAISLVALAGIMVNFANVLTIAIPNSNKMLISLIMYFLAATIGIIGLPYIYVNNLIFDKDMPKCKFNIKYSCVFVFIIILVIIITGQKYELLHNFIIAFAEEVLFRYIILNLFLKKFSKWKSYLIGSLIFAVVLHLNGDFIINFITKFPAGIILCYLTEKHGIQDSIFVHWSYNTLVSLFIL